MMLHWTRPVVVAWVVVAAATVSAAGVEVKLAPAGGAKGLFVVGDAADPPAVELWVATPGAAAGAVAAVRLSAVDGFLRPLPWSAEATLQLTGGGAVVRRFAVPGAVGLYRVTAAVRVGESEGGAWTEVGVVPAPAAGVRPRSFFASNTAELKTKEAGEFLRRLGVKVQRAHFQAHLAVPAGVDFRAARPEGWPLDFKDQEAALRDLHERGLWVLPIAGYSLAAAGHRARSGDAMRMDVHGPPRDFTEFAHTWRDILARHPDLRTVELWNEPWTWSWTWAAGPAEYRRMQTLFAQAVLGQDPGRRIIAGSSAMYVEDNIEPYPQSWRGLLTGVTHHPYGYGTDKRTWRAGDQFRSLDFGAQVARRMGLEYHLTESGTTYQEPRAADAPKALPHPGNNADNAAKVVQFYVWQALAGAVQGNMQHELGFGPGRGVCNVAFAVMTGLLEDRPIAAEIWPGHQLLTGAVFAPPALVTDQVKALPRAGELGVRWDVPTPAERGGDRTVVAVVWALTGPGEDELDAGGTLTMADAAGLRAVDLFGAPLPARDGKLTVPLGAAPVWIVSDTLGVVAVRDRIAAAEVAGVTAVNAFAQSLQWPAGEAQAMPVWVQSQCNEAVAGTVRLAVGGVEAGAADFELAPGALGAVALPWPGVAASATGQYAVRLVVESRTAAGRRLPVLTRDQLVQHARFARRTVTPDGDLADWGDSTPVTLDSRLLRRQVDPTAYLLNPQLDAPTGTPSSKRLVARVHTAYDDQWVYVAAAVHEPSFECKVGQKHPATDKVRGMPGGLGHPITCGDGLVLAFGLRDRVPHRGRQLGDPWAWKGHFYDTDHVFNVNLTSGGALVVRQWGPETSRRNGYEGEVVPGLGAVVEARAAVVRDEAAQVTRYEVALPRSQLQHFDPAAGKLRFGFLVSNNEGLGELTWPQAAGVFDYWRTSGSFGPTYSWNPACQTLFGVEPPPPAAATPAPEPTTTRAAAPAIATQSAEARP